MAKKPTTHQREERAHGVLARSRSRDHKRTLHVDHPTAAAFLDETGAIAHDRFFGVGCLVLADAPRVTRAIQNLRDRRHWYKEFHWSQLTTGTLSLYAELAEIVTDTDARFSCFVADREKADPVDRFGQNPWRAYEKLAAQLLIGSVRPYELLSVIADNYSTPGDVHFEQDVRNEVNARLERLAAVSVCRLDSRSCDPLQAVDLLTGAVTFEFRQQAGLAGERTPKAALARHVRELFAVDTVTTGAETAYLNVKIYK